MYTYLRASPATHATLRECEETAKCIRPDRGEKKKESSSFLHRFEDIRRREEKNEILVYISNNGFIHDVAWSQEVFTGAWNIFQAN